MDSLYQKTFASGNAPSIIDSDDRFEYRHVILPKQMLKLIPKRYFASDDSGLLRILEEDEWRGIGITQSLGWEHFEVHGKCKYGAIYVQSLVMLRRYADK